MEYIILVLTQANEISLCSLKRYLLEVNGERVEKQERGINLW